MSARRHGGGWELLHAPEIVCREYAVNERDGAVEALVDAASKDEALFRTLTHLALDADSPDEGYLLAASWEARTRRCSGEA